jgi:uncharacterized protein (DUF1501 family)
MEGILIAGNDKAPGLRRGRALVIGSPPDLDGGDLKRHTDFRSVYATLLDKWLVTPSTPVLGGSFPHLSFV